MTPEQAAAAAAWLAKEHPEWNQPAASAEAAAAQNAAWKANTLPVLPKFATPVAGTPGSESDLTRVYIGGTAETQGVARDLTRSEYIAMFGRTPEESESAKHGAAWQPVAFAKAHAAELADMSKSEIAARYGTGVADAVGDYYREHPSARYLAITGAYEYQQRNVVGPSGVMSQQAPSARNPYPEDSAAGIAWLVGRQQGATVTESLKEKAIAEKQLFGDYGGLDFDTERIVGGKTVAGIGVVSGMETIPVYREGEMQTIAGRTIYVPYGEQTQQELLDTKYIFDPVGGRIGIYQKPASIFEGEGFKRIYGIETASGSTGALQSGMFTLTPQSADIRTQWLPETYAGSADVVMAEELRARPELYSRLGAEAYGGKVALMDDRTLSPDTKMGRYPAEAGNLANLVDPFGVNRPKSELQATEPWSVEWSAAPVFQTMAGKGFGGTTVSPLPKSELAKVGVHGEGRLVGGGIVGGGGTITDIGLPTTPEVTITTEQPSGKVFGIDIPILSPALAFFQPGSQTTTKRTESQLPSKTEFEKREYYQTPEGYGYTDYYKTPGGVVATEEATTVSTPSDFDKLFEGANKDIRSVIGFDKMQTPTTEQIKSTAPYLGIVPGATPIAMALFTPGISDYAAEYLKGEIKAVMEKPAQAGLMLGSGVLMGGAFKAGEKIYGIGRAGIAEKVISEGGIWRGIEQGGHLIMTQGPKLLGGLYAADVGIRATQGGRDFSPAAAGRLGGIVAVEARPMTAGAMVGYTGPGKVYEAAKAAEANRAGTGLGIVRYYVGQPLQAAGGKTPGINIVKRATLEIPQFLEEAGGRPVEAAMRYIDYKMGPAPAPEVARAAVPPEMEYAGSVVYGKQRTIADILIAGRTPRPEPTTLQFPQEYVARATESDYIRLYRGESITDLSRPITSQRSSGRWFTNDITYAEFYKQRATGLRGEFHPKEYGIITYVDVPKTYASRFQKASADWYAEGAIEYVLPPEIAAKRAELPLGRPEPKIKGSVVYEQISYEPSPDIATKAYGKQPTISERIGDVYAAVQKASAKVPTAVREWYTPAGEAIRIENLNIRDIYGTISPQVRIKAAEAAVKNYFMERPNLYRDITTPLFTPKKGGRLGGRIAQEISDINTMQRLNQELLAAPKTEPTTAGKPFKKTPLNKTFGFGQPKPKPAAKPEGVETRTKNGMTLVSQVKQTAKPVARAEPTTIPRVSTLPTAAVTAIEYPSGPSPIQKQVVVVEEDVEYLPAGTMIIPRQERTLQQVPVAKVASVPILAVMQSQMQLPNTVQKQEQRKTVTPVNIYARVGESRFGAGSEIIPKTRELSTYTTELTRRSVGERGDIGFAIRTGLETGTITDTSVRTRQITQRGPYEWFIETPVVVPRAPAGYLPAGGVGGGYRKGAFRFVETLGFEMSRGRKGAFLSRKKKSPWGRF